MNVFAIRHGETVWSLSGQHTGTTDISLTDNGRRLTEQIRPVLAKQTFALVLVSPMQRARETCALAGLGDVAGIDSDLAEWNHGEHEGLTPKQIHEIAPGWLIFWDGWPGSEASEQVAARVDRVIARAHAAEGDVALFAHGHLLRVLAARWAGLPAGGGHLKHTSGVPFGWHGLPPGAPSDCRRKATASRLPPHLVSNVERRMEDQGLTGRTSRRPIAAGQRLAPATGPKNRLIGSRLPNSGLQQIFE